MRRRPANLKRIPLAVTAAILCIAVFILLLGKLDNSIFNFPTQNSADDFVKIIDVGQGDCILIHSNGSSALLDTGPESGANALCEVLYKNGISNIDVLMISHLHSDHTGGISRLFTDFSVDNLILPELSTYSEGMGAVQLAINEVSHASGGVYHALQGMNFTLGDFEITVLANFGDMEDENNRSLFIMAEMDGRKFLFTGDAETEAEKALLEENLDISCDVLKVGHHGSTTSSSEDFLKAALPRYAAISVGKDNSYGHPHKEILRDLENIGAEILRTDKCGDITFYIENGKITPETKKY